jgi:3-hydroxyacyl-[acyl-carrier-protein] dehydratase
MTSTEGSKESEIAVDLKEIMRILPHRYPFLLVDKILRLDLEKNEIVGQKNVTFNEAFFQGHFPGSPIMPGVLVLEALAQTGGILAYKKGYQERIAVLLSINNAKFRRPIYPGDVLELHCSDAFFGTKGGKVVGVAKVSNQVVVEAEIWYALVEGNQI